MGRSLGILSTCGVCSFTLNHCCTSNNIAGGPTALLRPAPSLGNAVGQPVLLLLVVWAWGLGLGYAQTLNPNPNPKPKP